jgi:transcriptional regulator of arginine metabolism
MKRKRHIKILELIENYDIDTQEALQQKLFECGFNVTQATVSRDIKELKLVKILSSSGEYKYSLPPNLKEKNPLSMLISLFSESVITIDYAINTVVIKCHVGMANAVCAKLDSADFQNVVGTLAGDDTIFVLMRTESDAIKLVENLNNLISK